MAQGSRASKAQIYKKKGQHPMIARMAQKGKRALKVAKGGMAQIAETMMEEGSLAEKMGMSKKTADKARKIFFPEKTLAKKLKKKFGKKK